MNSAKKKIERGANYAYKFLLDSFYIRIEDSVGGVIRYSGYLVVIAIAYLHYGFQAFAITHSEIHLWGITYVSYLLMLEVFRYFFEEYYDRQIVRLARALLSTMLITLLLIIIKDGQYVIALLYLIPVISAFVYFSGIRQYQGVVLGAISIGLLIGFLISFDFVLQSAITQYFFVLIALLSVAAVILRSMARPNYLGGVANKIHSFMDLHNLICYLLDTAMVLTRAQNGIITIIDQKSGRYIDHVSKGLNLREGRSIENFSKKCTVVQTREAFFSNDVRREFTESTIYEKYFDNSPRSIIAEPILNGDGTVIGVISVTSDSPSEFDSIAQYLMNELCSYAATAIENALFRRLATLQELKTEDSINRFAKSTTPGMVIDATLNAILGGPDSVDAAAYIDAMVLNRPDVVSSVLQINDEAISKNEIETAAVTLGKRALREKKPIVIRDIHDHQWIYHALDGESSLKSFIAIPVMAISQSRPLGAIIVGSSEVDVFDLEDEIKYFKLAHQCSINLSKFAKIEAISNEGGILKKINETFRSINYEQDETELYTEIVENAADILGFSYLALWLKKHDSDMLFPAAVYDENNSAGGIKSLSPMNPQLVNMYLSEENSVRGSYLVRRGDRGQSSTSNNHPIARLRGDANSIETGLDWSGIEMIITPLKSISGEDLGLIVLEEPKHTAHFSDDTFLNIAKVSSAVETIIKISSITRGLNDQQNRISSFINSLSQIVSETDDEQAMGELIVHVAAEFLSVEGCSLYRVVDDKIELINSTYLNNTEYIGKQKDICVEDGCGLTSFVASKKTPLLFNNRDFKMHHAWTRDESHSKHLPVSNRTHSLILVPILGRDNETVGVISIENKRRYNQLVDFNNQDMERLLMLAESYGVGLQAIRMNLRSSIWERKNLGDDVHELINFIFTNVVHPLEDTLLIANELGYPKLVSKAQSALDGAITAGAEFRNVLSLIHKEITEDHNLSESLMIVSKRWDDQAQKRPEKQIILECDQSIEFPYEMRLSIAKIATNALSNAIKYSGYGRELDTNIRVKVYSRGSMVTFFVWDNGYGCDNISEKAGYGLTRMGNIIKEINSNADLNYEASMQIYSKKNHGTKVTVTIRDRISSNLED